ncbi:hypothetical protein [Amycolatopsis thermophila]|uniref:Uncharacterized protein n=1 Tax=Amycolatopsis thermophila TaxID=206084 RepID=A0ABU0F1E6_9PSEU|nr:hypothetical protein [Amycolatopsis thermophila]MDQ0381390.1 hypothetical protein [Amycolatopsis thermophila]
MEMVVYVPDDGRGVPQLCRAEDLGALSVRAAAGAPRWELLSRTLGAAGAGEVAGEHAWLDVAWLRSAAGDRDQNWHDGFTRMLAYASDLGWVSADGGRVRAHVEWGR